MVTMVTVVIRAIRREGSFYGLVVMPSTYLIDDKLEFVSRYVYQASEGAEGISSNSRYFESAR